MTDAATADLGIVAGAPTTAEQAQARIEQLKAGADPDWLKRHVDGSLETRNELERLHEIIHRQPAGAVVTDPTVEQARSETADHLSATADLPPAVIEQIRTGTPVSQTEYQLAKNRKSALMSDPAWVAKYMANGHEERRTMMLLNVILSSPIKLHA
jgi:outer membrane biogenesis lipoprotein LolB